jgi:hypothetical protein
MITIHRLSGLFLGTLLWISIVSLSVHGTTAQQERKEQEALLDSLSESKTEHCPVRERYRQNISLEFAWNGLVGTGILYSYHPMAKLAVEGGIGLSSMGVKTGCRLRYNFLTGEMTPFIGVGFMRASGFKDAEKVFKTSTVKFNIRPIHFIRLSFGLDFISGERFSFTPSAGWSIPLNKGVRDVEYVITDGTYTIEDAKSAFDQHKRYLYEGGISLALTFGFSF